MALNIPASDPLVPFMNQEGPLENVGPNTRYTDATRPTFNIGSPIRFRWLVPTGLSPFGFKLMFHGKRATQLVGHTLIKNIVAGDWTADGTIVLHGQTFDRYYHDHTISDNIPGLYSICLQNNGRHYLDTNGNVQYRNEADTVTIIKSYHHDAGFVLNPAAAIHHDDLVDRTELFSRVAGEKAAYEDEYVAAGQIEGGIGVNIRWRTQAGVLSGYSTDPLLGFNVVIENGLLVGTNVVSGVNLVSGAAIAWGSESTASPLGKVLFSDEPDWIYDALLARTGINPGTTWDIESIPVHAQYVESPTGTVNVSLRTLHTGLYASHDNGTIVTQKNSAPNGSIGHIQFKDSASVTFTVTEASLDGHRGYRPGITVEAAALGASLPDQPSLITRWWWTPQYGIRFAGDWGLGSQYLGVSNWFDCHSEMSFSPWGPMDDSLNIAGDVGTAVATLFIEHEEKWTGPSGAFTKVAGRQTRASVLAEHSTNFYPYTEGALQVNQDGYYHLDWKAVLALQRVMDIDQNTAWNFDYYSIWNLRLAVFRTATGEWHWHSTTADSKWVHHQRETDLLPYQNNFAKSFASLRTDLQGSCDIWLNNGDKIQFYLDSKGKNGNNQALQILGGYQNDYSYLLDTHAWQGNLTAWEFNMHWLHDDTAFSKNDSNHPNAANAPNRVFDLIDPTWRMPWLTFPTYSEFK